MTDLKLHEGCFVRLADGSVCGPLKKQEQLYSFIGQSWNVIGEEVRYAYGPMRVTAVYATLQEAAGHDHTEAVLDWLKERGLSVSDLSDPGAVTDQLSWYERAIFEERASPLSQIPSEKEIKRNNCVDLEYMEMSATDAPQWYSAEEASSWANGWNNCIDALKKAGVCLTSNPALLKGKR